MIQVEFVYYPVTFAYMKLRIVWLCLGLALFTKVAAQSTYPGTDFSSPLPIPLSLAGNFGEIRPNHFHAGFDLRTNNREGMSVMAAADGYVSRIKISPYGYGKAIYIQHPNGYTSVYGHLSVLKDSIGRLSKAAQYAKQSFELDTLLSPGLLPVKKGDIIALSGNTGGSQGPHLHFEIRETATEMPVNPYFFGYSINDKVAPRITEIVVYPLGPEATVNHSNQLKKIKPVFSKNGYSYQKGDSVSVCGPVGFGISCYDQESGSYNHNGVFSIELLAGGKRVYYHQMEKFKFDNARYVNAHIDFAEKQKHNTIIQKCFLSKNDQLGIYSGVVNHGYINFNDDTVHWITFVVKDFYGNTARLPLKVHSNTKTLNGNEKQQPKSPLQDCFSDFSYPDNPYFQVKIPAGALYDDYAFVATAENKEHSQYAIVHLLDETQAVQKPIQLKIRAANMPLALQDKACLIQLIKGEKMVYAGGSYENGWVAGQVKNLGTYSIAVDTLAPQLKLLGKTIGNLPLDYSKSTIVAVKATDQLSGIVSYKASIDNKWVLCEYEVKKNLLYYTFDDTIATGIHDFKLIVSDDKNNSSVIAFQFKR